MGLFSRKIKNPVHGTAQIVGCSAHGGEGRWQNCRMQLVVHVEGQQPYSTEVHQLAPRAKWPQPGMMVPVLIAPDDRDRLKVDFESMPDKREMARQMAEQQAQAAAQGGGALGAMPGMPMGAPTAGGAPGMPQVNIIGDPSQLPPDKLAKLEQMTGMDLDGDGTVGGAPRPAAAAAAGGDDRIAQLERLAQLKASGALTDDEFEAEKRRLLGS